MAHINLTLINCDLNELPENFKNADTVNAIIEYNSEIIWKDGTWERGTWEGGTWERGTWEYGTWKYGTWEGGIWKVGTWESGTWKGGIWKVGIWENGTWENGIWENGTWKYGTWKNGIWKYGTWKGGFKQIGFCKWCVFYSDSIIKIGCEKGTLDYWDTFFNSDEVFETPRDTEEFKNIYKSYLMAKHAIELNKIIL